MLTISGSQISDNARFS